MVSHVGYPHHTLLLNANVTSSAFIFKIAGPLLKALPAEPAHHLTLRALQLFGTVGRRSSRGSASVDVAGLRFPNPIGLAAGFDKDGIAVRGLLKLPLGFIELGAVTPRPQPGNNKPRVFRLTSDHAVINRLGFNNAGVDALALRLEALGHRPIPVGVNISRNRHTSNENAFDDISACMSRLHNLCDFFTVNISSPNTPELRQLERDDRIQSDLQRVVRYRDELDVGTQHKTPIFVKISPDLPRSVLESLVASIQDAGCSGIVATNTTTQRPQLTSQLRDQPGGLSGVPLFPIALKTVQTIRQTAGPDFPIVGVGGISCSEDIDKMFNAGANLVQIYTALIYQGPSLLQRICP